jgi:lysophospholipase
LPTEAPCFHLPAGGRFETLAMADGLAVRAWALPHPDPRGRILVLNGRADFLEKWAGVMGDLAALGLSVAAFDWRGQGGSGREVGNGAGHIDRFETWLDDLDRIVAWASTALPDDAPALALGHSMGGHLLLRWLARQRLQPFERIVLTAPFVSYAMPASALLGLAARAACALGLGRAYAPGQRPYGPERMAPDRMAILTADPERFLDEGRWVALDPGLAVGGVTWGWLRAADSSLAALSRADLSGLPPALLLLAGRERLVSNRAALGLRLPACETHLIAGAGHEILREADAPRQEALSRIAAFLAKGTE